MPNRTDPDVKVPLTPEELSRRFPTSYRPLGRFKDNPNYFRRKDRILETEEGRLLRKRLKRRGLPDSYALPLLRLGFSPSKLVQRLRDLEALTEEIQTLIERVKDSRSRLKLLLRKPNHEPVPVNSIPFSTDNPEPPSAAADAPSPGFPNPS